MERRGRWASPGNRAAAAVLVVAFGVRLAWLVGTRHLVLANDPADYQRLAVSIASGHGFGRSVLAYGNGPTAFRPPLWPLFLGVLYWLIGVHLLAARFVEVVLGTLTVGLIGLLAGQIWGRRPALAAMALAALYPGFVLAGGSLLSESLSLPLAIGSLSAALAARRSSRPFAWCALSGLLCGLDILCRPDSFVLILPAVLLAGVSLTRWRLRATAVLVVVAILTVTPWLVRDRLVMGRFVPVTTQAGFVASGTYNSAAADDRTAPASWRPPVFVPQYVRYFRGTEVQEDAALEHAALHYIARHPLYPFRVAYWNLLRLFDLTGVSDARTSWGANGYGPSLASLDAVGLALLAAFWAVGTGEWLARRARPSAAAADPPARVGTAALWLAPLLVALVTVPVLGESRLRVGLDPFLVLAAVPGLCVAVDRLGRLARAPWPVGLGATGSTAAGGLGRRPVRRPVRTLGGA